jgi:hypothetical protein
MREIRQSGSEGGEPQLNVASLPLSRFRRSGSSLEIRLFGFSILHSAVRQRTAHGMCLLVRL